MNSKLFVNAVKEIIKVRAVNIKLNKKINLMPGETIERSYTSYMNLNGIVASLRKVSVNQGYTMVYSDATSILYAKRIKGIVFFHHVNFSVSHISTTDDSLNILRPFSG